MTSCLTCVGNRDPASALDCIPPHSVCLRHRRTGFITSSGSLQIPIVLSPPTPTLQNLSTELAKPENETHHPPPFAPLLGATTAQDQQGQPFTLNIRWSNSPLSGPLNANSGSFYTGKPTTALCPENVPEVDCPPVNTTSFVAQGSRLFLNAALPGGQQVYISPTGRLTYTLPHSSYIPPGSLTDLPIFSNSNSFLNPFLTLWLCADDSDSAAKSWRVWAEYTNATTGAITNNGLNGGNACTRIALEAVPYTGPKAYLYWTDYDAILKRGY